MSADAEFRKEFFGQLPRTITIVAHGRGFTIHEGERYCCWLSWDEMIGQIVAMTMPRERITNMGGSLYPMVTPEQAQQQEEARAARFAEIRREEQLTIQGENAP